LFISCTLVKHLFLWRLYGWQIELDLNLLKTVLRMEPLSCRTPAMVRKEVWIHLLAYNLVRGVMGRAARRHQVPVRELSFTGALQAVQSFAPYLAFATPAQQARMFDELLRVIAQRRVGNRPGRTEPRKRKRRQGKHPYLTKPRKVEKEEMMLDNAA
jgi:hypothetical protein